MAFLNRIKLSYYKKSLLYAAVVTLVFVTVFQTSLSRTRAKRPLLQWLSTLVLLDTEQPIKLQTFTNYGVFIILDGNDTSASGPVANLLKTHFPSDFSLKCSKAIVEFRLYLIFYSDDKYFSATENRQAAIAYANESLQQCAKQKTHVQLQTMEINNRAEDGRLLSNFLRDAYVFDNLDYFYLVLKGSTKTKVTGLLNLAQNLQRLSPASIGIVPELTGSSPRSLFISKTHLEIFGDFFQWSIPDLKSAVEFVLSIYQASVTTVAPSVAPVQSKWPEQFRQELETLQRYMTAVKSAPECLRCRHQKSRQVIAMSLYGDSNRYTMGAIRNAQLFPVTFPGWRLRFYCERPSATDGSTNYGTVPAKILNRLTELGAEIYYMDLSKAKLAPMLWRFTIVEDLDVDLFAVRDCDSRLTPRDSAVVADWLKTSAAFHCIRDHPSHSNYAVSGGLWGGRRKQLNAIFNGSFTMVMRGYGAGYVEDMNFLGRDVWPKVQSVAYCHDSFSCQRYPSSHAFPVVRIAHEHLGQVYDEHSIGRQGDIDILAGAAINTNCIPK